MRILLLVAVAAIVALPAVADDADGGASMFVGQEVDTSFEVSRSRLTAQGYSEIEMENGSAYHLMAHDPEGTEVLLAIDPRSGEHSIVTSP
jgi:hypothetical protein